MEASAGTASVRTRLEIEDQSALVRTPDAGNRRADNRATFMAKSSISYGAEKSGERSR